ncbi:ABC transporter ATP-binding protein [Actinophytocola sp.]|uniref:ABC transporter ATP-binding protein n=1 Tax=Actinophytocola sp. TaxID=1872138 RepID=UPI003D6A85B0
MTAPAARRAARNGDSPLLRIEDLCIDFRTSDGWVRVVDDLTLEVRRGETLGLVGESGSGKTVTVQSVLGLLSMRGGRIAGGHVWFGDRDLVRLREQDLRDVRGNEIAMIFQEPMTSLNPAFKIGSQIAETVMRHRGATRRAAWNRAVEVLDIVGIPDPARRVHDYPHMFSGGMRQRAMIAMALACEPKLLLADEPTTALDVTVQARIMELLRTLQAQFGMAIVLVTHDLLLAAENCGRVVVMYAGQAVEQSPSEDIFDRPLHPYAEGLLRSMPQAADSEGWLRPIKGNVPSPWDKPTGCRFHTRCDYVDPLRCTTDPILLTSHPGNRDVRCVRATELHLRSPQHIETGSD